MSDILTGTPPDLTYANPLVREAWTVVWAVTSGALVVIVGWMGLSLIVSEHVGGRSAGWRETFPRLVLGLVAAATSLWWCSLVIDVAAGVSGFVAESLGVNPGNLLRAPLKTLLIAVESGSVGMAQLMALIYLIYGFFVLYVLVADDRAPRADRLASGPRADCVGTVDPAAHGGLGEAVAADVHDDGLPAGGAAHRACAGVRVPERVRGDMRPSSRCRT